MHRVFIDSDIITRNKKHYKRSKIAVCTAEEYLNIWASQLDENGYGK